MTTSFAGGPAQALVAATIAFSAGLTTLALFGPIAKRLRDDMELDPTTLAFLIAVPSLAGSLLRIPFGAWADTVGGHLPNVVLLLTSIVGVLGLAIVFSTGTPSVAALSICGTMAGAGIACFSVGVAMVGYWYPRERQGTALGLYAGIGNMGPGLACLLVTLATEHIGIAEAYAELNPQDAMQLGVIAGDRVRISSRRGSVEADAQIAESTPPGCDLPAHAL